MSLKRFMHPAMETSHGEVYRRQEQYFEGDNKLVAN